ncbi:MAG: polyphosphate polymerase domain-containing protein [Clostridia bacterium]|nr:polyphosphate polymerase domain-containing protein [Clostridia bacterium]
MATMVFNRYEMKFLLTPEQYEKMKIGFGDKMKLDPYNEGGKLYTIMNLYYDTPKDDLVSIALTHEGKYRYKVRLRSYDPNLPTAFLEVKKKVEGLVNKRRSLMYIDDVDPFLEEHVDVPDSPILQKQIVHELNVIAHDQTLVPKVVLCYDREAYFGTQPEDGDLRVTFDRNIRSRRYDLDLRLGSHGENILKDDRILMEVKVERSVPLWLAHLISSVGARKQRFSKYGTEFSQYITAKQEEKEHEYA